MKNSIKFNLTVIGAVVLLAVVLLAVLLPAIVLPFTSTLGVASAINVTLPDSGVVGENLLKNSDFTKNSNGKPTYSTSSTAVAIVDDWYMGTAGEGNTAQYIVDKKRLISSVTEQNGYYANIYQFLPLSEFVGKSLHFHVQLDSYVGNWLIQLWAMDETTKQTVALASSNYQETKNYLDLTYYVDLETASKYTNFRFLIQTRDELVNLNAKCEIGTAFTGWVPDYQNTIDDLQTKYDDLQTKYDDLQNKYDDLQNKYDDLQNKYDDIQHKYDVFVDSGFMGSTLSVNSISRLSAFYDDNGETKTLSAEKVGIVRNSSGMQHPIVTPDSSYPNDVTYNVLYFNGTSDTKSFNNGGVGVGITVPITSFNNDLGFVPANADMTFTLHDTFVVRLDNLYYGVHSNALRFAFYGKDGRQIYLSKDTWKVGSNQVLSTRGSWLDIFGSVDTVPCQFGMPEFSQSYTFNIPYDVYFIGIFMPTVTSTADYSVGYNMTLTYQNEGSSDYVYDVGFQDGVNSVNKDNYYNEGYDEGYRVGQEIGYANGSKAQGNYTFLGLIGAAIDAPIQSLTSMFDFEVLGVNMKGFVLSCFTLSIILVVLRMVLGGR